MSLADTGCTLWVGDVGSDTARFDPFLQSVQAKFSVTPSTLRGLASLFGLGRGRTPPSPTPAADTAGAVGQQGPPFGGSSGGSVLGGQTIYAGGGGGGAGLDGGGGGPDAGADTPVWLATSPEVDTITGQFFVKRKAVATAPHTTDPARCDRLWDESARLVGQPATT